ncbi:hypothetical protein V8C86DRAFT_2436419 [Haematococcus lacustris]
MYHTAQIERPSLSRLTTVIGPVLLIAPCLTLVINQPASGQIVAGECMGGSVMSHASHSDSYLAVAHASQSWQVAAGSLAPAMIQHRHHAQRQLLQLLDDSAAAKAQAAAAAGPAVGMACMRAESRPGTPQSRQGTSQQRAHSGMVWPGSMETYAAGRVDRAAEQQGGREAGRQGSRAAGRQGSRAAAGRAAG